MKYKVIKSAAHNFGHSFVSLINFCEDEYVMDGLARAAVRSGEPTLTVDLLGRHADPSVFLTPRVQKSIDWYCGWFPGLIERHGIDFAVIRSAVLTLSFNLSRVSDDRGFNRHFQLPFECVVRVEDDRGKIHVGLVRDWWSASYEDPASLHRLRMGG